MAISVRLYGQLSKLLVSSGCGYTLNREGEGGEDMWASLINAIGAAADMPQMSGLKEMAKRLSAKIAHADPFIMDCNGKVCPQCEGVCCLNKFGRYDIGDVIYLAALGYRPAEILSFSNHDPECLPCKYLSQAGCVISRQLRPFRCNWFFCIPIIEYMENGNKKAYRGFSSLFHEIIRLRKDMLDEFCAYIKVLSESA
ncbi:MAG: hypothetical protein HQK96_19880 [Nitrospirae bacterium]|nr:hypothetical protein [Nitrospirota bacterium]